MLSVASAFVMYKHCSGYIFVSVMKHVIGATWKHLFFNELAEGQDISLFIPAIIVSVYSGGNMKLPTKKQRNSTGSSFCCT